MGKVTTKKCPLCGNEWLVLLPSLNKKVCNNHVPVLCIDWELEEGQASLHTNKIGGRD